ncbi:MAG: T9SS type A sorting domain-containing protein [Bacteroidales bacterium]|nr:T9SS type A sorting domain-containing protein [Bacteroidales bacterium]
MHRFSAILLLVAGLFSSTAAQTDCTVTNDNWQSLQLTITVGDIQTAGTGFQTIYIDGLQPSSRVGAPQLPLFSHLIEVPLCKGFDIDIADDEYDTLQLAGGLVMPAQSPRSKSDTAWHPMEIDRSIYSKDAYYGETPATVEAIGIARDRRLARLQFAPVRYNPVQNKLIVCRKAKLTISYRGADPEATLEMFERYHSPAFNSGAQTLNDLYPKAVRTTAPVRYVIVANSMFRGHLDDFVQWKRRKGFMTDIVYTDNPSVGNTTSSIQTYLRGLYTDATTASPAPTYVLLVGDVAQLPAFSAQVTSPSSDHVTDLYYMTWTVGDHLPDCHYGRFSAQTVAQLTPQVQKTLMYEQYTFADPSFLDRAVMVAGVDGGSAGDFGYTHADPAMDYAIINYVNGAHGFANVYYFKNNVSIVPTGVTNVTVSSSASGNSAVVRQYYNLGAGLINYSAHGGSTGWGTPNFGNSHVAQMTNVQKFGLMIGNCCLTNKFEESTCFGEALLRKDNYCGAVGYIGGSNSTYWSQDFYWAVGIRSNIGPNMSMAYNSSNLGVYDRTFHTHGESYVNWCTTQGSMLMQGNMAVEASSSGTSMKHYYWEIYHLMGDPSVMPYMTQADTMTISASAALPYGTATLSVIAVPYAYVALTDTVTGNLISAAYANNSGVATLSIPANLPVGDYIIAASAQQYRTTFRSVGIIPPGGAYPVVTAIDSDPLNAGDTVPLVIHVENPGNETARNIVLNISSPNPMLTFTATTATLDSLPAGSTAVITSVRACVSPYANDNTDADINTSTSWTGGILNADRTLRVRLYAPVLDITFSNSTPAVLPGDYLTISATLRNIGHAPSSVQALTFGAPTSLLAATPASTAAFALAPTSDTTVSLTLHADASLPMNITVPVSYTYGPLAGNLPVFIGQPFTETFEGGTTHLAGWVPNVQYPWAIIDSQAVEGTHCMRSAIYMGHSQTSETSLTVNVAAADSVSFYYRVSSEANYDKFHFLIDNVSQFDASGDVDWTRAAYPLSAGTHTLTFRYAKDYSVSNGSDCAWIDNIVVPSPSNTVTFSQIDLCQGDIHIVSNDTIGLTVGNFAVVDGNTLVEYTVHPNYTGTSSVSACDSLLWDGILHTDDFTYNHTDTTVFGCDSSQTVTVHIYHSAYDTVSVSTQANNYHWQGGTYTESGTYTATLTTTAGCDSVVTLVLTFDHPQNGIGLIADEAILAYPSPTAGPVAFSCEVAVAEVYDLQGRLLLRRERTSGIDLSTLPQGVYLLRLTTDAGTATLRVERL